MIQSKKWITLKFIGDLSAIAMTNNAKFEEELTFQFKIDMRNLLNFDESTRKISKICTLMGCFRPKYIIFELKKYREVKFDGTED